MANRDSDSSLSSSTDDDDDDDDDDYEDLLFSDLDAPLTALDLKQPSHIPEDTTQDVWNDSASVNIAV